MTGKSRDLQIHRAYEAGASFENVGRKFRLSRERVRQIVRDRERRERRDFLSVRAERFLMEHLGLPNTRPITPADVLKKMTPEDISAISPKRVRDEILAYARHEA